MKNVWEEARQIFKSITLNAPGKQFQLDTDLHKKLLNFFQVGDYYFYVFDVKNLAFDFVSSEVENVLGYPSTKVSAPFLLDSIHPEDVPWFLNFENKVVSFFISLKKEQILKYKVRYDYRVRKSNGEYIRILQQVITLQYDENSGGILRTFGVHTDITHLKKEGKPVLSLIGMDGEPSYIDVKVDDVFHATPSIISQREKQVLHLLIEGKNSQAIANNLFISQQTVSKHRKNMLRKTNSSSTAELVAMAIKNGWI